MKFLTPAIAVFALCAVMALFPRAGSAGATQAGARSGSGGAAQTQMADAVFKNVQVLKGIPIDQFLGTMGLFAAALSYDCSGCHTGAGTEDPKWEDDTPRKLTARRMIAMVQT